MIKDNNTVIIICSTLIALAIIIGIISGNLPEQVNLVLAGGLVGIGGGLVGNLQRKNDVNHESKEKTDRPVE